MEHKESKTVQLLVMRTLIIYSGVKPLLVKYVLLGRGHLRQRGERRPNSLSDCCGIGNLTIYSISTRVLL